MVNTGKQVALDHWPVVTRFDIQTIQFPILPAQTGHIRSRTRFSKEMKYSKMLNQ